jgi:hypothetical protein
MKPLSLQRVPLRLAHGPGSPPLIRCFRIGKVLAIGRQQAKATSIEQRLLAQKRRSLLSHYEAVNKLGQAPSRLLIFQGFRRFRSEPVPFFTASTFQPEIK